jgi:alanine dehydrogenase
MIVLSDEIIAQRLSMESVIELVEQAFAADARGQAITFPAIVENVGLAHAHVGIKSGYLRLNGGEEILGLKAGGYWRQNATKFGLPSHRATILMISPENGEPLAVMSANIITRMRTAAAGAVAARHLANRDASVVSVFGTGEQAHAQVEALRLVREVKRIHVWGRNEAAVAKYAAVWRARGVESLAMGNPAEALAVSGIVITATPSQKALVLDEWIKPGTHINAVGSDGVGKQELDPKLIRRSKFVADKLRQSLTIGELQLAVAQGEDAKKWVYAELGEICAGLKPGRESAGEITIFDSSGVSFQDLAVANFLMKDAQEGKLGVVI